MKRILTVMICAIFTLSLVSAQDMQKKDAKVTTKFLVTNMDCENCVKKVEKQIAFERGVTDLKCDLKTKSIEVTYRTDRTSDEKLIAALKKIDMQAEVIKEGEMQN